MTLTEAANWITLLDVERKKTEMREKREETQAARAPGAADQAFCFKDRVLQQIAAQVDIYVSKLRVTITGLAAEAAAVDGHDEVNEDMDGMMRTRPQKARSPGFC